MAQQTEILGIERRKALLAATVAAALGIGTIALLGQVAEYGELEQALVEANHAWLALTVVGLALGYAGYVLGYRSISRARGGPRFGYWTTARIVALSFGAFVVGSTAGGLAVDYWALHRAGESLHSAARRVLALNTLEWGVLACGAALAGAFLLALPDEDAPLGMALGWLSVTTVCVAAAVWVSAPERAERLTALRPEERPELDRRPGTWLPWLRLKARRGFADAVGGVRFVRHLVSHPLGHPGAFAGFPIYWLGDLVILWSALHALGADIGAASLVLAYATGYVVSAAPLPAGGSGAAEATLAFTLHAVGVPLASAVLAAVIYRAVTFWLPIPIALAFLPTARSLNDELPALAR